MSNIYCGECGTLVGEADFLEGESFIGTTCSGCQARLTRIDPDKRINEIMWNLAEAMQTNDRGNNGPTPQEEGE